MGCTICMALRSSRKERIPLVLQISPVWSLVGVCKLSSIECALCRAHGLHEFVKIIHCVGLRGRLLLGWSTLWWMVGGPKCLGILFDWASQDGCRMGCASGSCDGCGHVDYQPIPAAFVHVTLLDFPHDMGDTWWLKWSCTLFCTWSKAKNCPNAQSKQRTVTVFLPREGVTLSTLMEIRLLSKWSYTSQEIAIVDCWSRTPSCVPIALLIWSMLWLSAVGLEVDSWLVLEKLWDCWQWPCELSEWTGAMGKSVPYCIFHRVWDISVDLTVRWSGLPSIPVMKVSKCPFQA